MGVNIEEKFLCCESDEKCYIIPIMDVKKIAPSEKYENREAILFGENTLETSHIYGIIDIKPENQHEVPTLISDEKNKHINGIAYWEEENKLCFLLNSKAMRNEAK